MDNIINWDEFFMGVAILTSKRSKDPRCKVGSCLVDTENKIIATGYNGFPRGCKSDIFPLTSRAEASSFLESKHPYMCHSEMNCILNSNGSLNKRELTLYTTNYPCHECAKIIIQAGITTVVYLYNERPDSDSIKASVIMFDHLGINHRKFSSEKKGLDISFEAKLQ